ncbi:RHS repeat-associated core domain-containing protein [Saccharomonospora piscinae]|uniref:RHS repeat-associated core domain-containing protein n=1 Tax=Saccharomonospora piscinae TaxID=687388 RepID=UPI0015930A30|nr:RHS repeat-associated core domain-containing protein [Saccharomonospora piscinae]
MEFNAFDELVADGTASYAYDGLNRLIAADGAALSYVGTGIKVASDHTGDYTYTPDGTPLGMTHTGGAGLAWTDSHTDLIGLINPSTGALAGSRTYSPFGERTDHHGTQPALGYQHQYTDPDTGNVNMGARWYQPHTSTFTNRDTATLNPHDLTNANRHTYAANNPLTYTDPTGRYVHCAPAIAAGPIGIGGCAAGSALVVGIVAGYQWLTGSINPPAAHAPTQNSAPPQNDYIHVNPMDEAAWLKNRTTPRNKAWAHETGTTNPVWWPNHGTHLPVSATATTSAATAAAAAQAAAAAARRAFLEARRQRIIDDVNTPHPRPPKTTNITDNIRQALEDANKTIIDLGVITPHDQNTPYQPQTTPGIGQPGPPPTRNRPTRKHLHQRRTHQRRRLAEFPNMGMRRADRSRQSTSRRAKHRDP